MKKVMKKIKGFTLIELLGVIVLIAAIAIISFPKVMDLISGTKETLSSATKQFLFTQVDSFVYDNINLYPKNEGSTYCVSVRKLAENDLIKTPFTDSNGEEVSLDTLIKVSVVNNEYKYDIDNSCTEANMTPPSIAMNVSSGVVNSNGWATSKFYVNVNGDNLTSYKYCVSSSECEPNTEVNGNSGSIYVQTAGTNYVCIKGINTAGETETMCNQYKLDESEINFVVATNDGAFAQYNCPEEKAILDITVTSASLTGIDHYEYCYKVKDSSSPCVFQSTKETHLEFNDIDADIAYEFVVKAISNSGKSAEKKFTIQLKGICFIAGTKVYTENGFKNIEEINIGDKVWAINLDTNEKVLSTVVDTIISTTTELYHITANGETVTASPRHQFYVQDKGWVRAYDLKEGDVLFNEDATYPITSIVHEKSDKYITTYNLIVENNHNYLVTNNLLLVHNAPSVCPEDIEPGGEVDIEDPNVPL